MYLISNICAICDYITVDITIHVNNVIIHDCIHFLILSILNQKMLTQVASCDSECNSDVGQ